MRAFVYLLLVMPLSARAQEFSEEDRYGKSCADVLAMGHEKWVDWFTDGSRGGQSTAGMAAAERIYSECMKARTKEVVDRLSEAEQAWIRGVEKSLQTVASKCAEAGSGMTGGGTMWIPVTDAAEVGVQEAVWDVLHPESLPPKLQADQDSVWREWRKAEKAVKKNGGEIDDMASISGIGLKKVEADLEAVSKEVASLVRSVADKPVGIKKRIFFQCRRLIEMVSLSG